ncbi:hypothetical protein KP509_19G054300 [Ceratopteris richardii]|uniref:Uncharacterized protein n=1 Tax=Ceratopteris richardii TaxID=49495 RepID=A0A8T2SMI8_CERRI|nr:hypothetical protein KP509_19G054300 [Ceratopteris richardii]
MEVNTVVKLGNLFMSFLFAYSASVQLNDTDWYFWFPFYSSASLISLIHGTEKARYPLWSILNLCFGLLLLIKVIIEAAPMTAILSLDMNERVVREKCGSFLVISTMGLQIQSMLNGKERERFNAIGICCIVLLSIGLCSKYFLA